MVYIPSRDFSAAAEPAAPQHRGRLLGSVSAGACPRLERKSKTRYGAYTLGSLGTSVICNCTIASLGTKRGWSLLASIRLSSALLCSDCQRQPTIVSFLPLPRSLYASESCRDTPQLSPFRRLSLWARPRPGPSADAPPKPSTHNDVRFSTCSYPLPNSPSSRNDPRRRSTITNTSAMSSLLDYYSDLAPTASAVHVAAVLRAIAEGTFISSLNKNWHRCVHALLCSELVHPMALIYASRSRFDRPSTIDCRYSKLNASRPLSSNVTLLCCTWHHTHCPLSQPPHSPSTRTNARN